MTNADYIRTMSDENMADFLLCIICRCVGREDCSEHSYKMAAKWLKEPFKGD